MKGDKRSFESDDKAEKTPERARTNSPGGASVEEGRARPLGTAGNLAVQRLLRAGAIRARLKVGRPGDPYEEEAERVADSVVSSAPVGVVQRQCAACADGGTCPKCEEERLQAREEPGRAPRLTPGVESKVAGLRGAGRPLDDSARAFFEPRFGRDFGDVRVHTDASAADSARAIGARAFTTGSDVAFAPGEYEPETTQGKRLLGHELTHVVQQSRGDLPAAGGEGLVQRAPGDGATPSPDEQNFSTDPSQQVCAAEPQEDNVCWQPEESPRRSGRTHPLKGGDYIFFEGFLWSTDAEQVREELGDAIKTLGKDETYALIVRLEITQGGVGDSAAAGALVPQIVEVVTAQMRQIEQDHERFKQTVRAAAQVRLERSRQSLALWKSFLNEKLTAEQAQGQILAESTYSLGVKAARDSQNMAWFEQYLTTHYLYIQQTRADILEDKIHGGCQQCHSENFYRGQEFRKFGDIGRRPSVLETLERRAQEEQDAPANRPRTAEGQPAGRGLPESVTDRDDAALYPGVQRAAKALDVLRPYLEELGPSGYRVIDPTMINTGMPPAAVVAVVSGQIEKRREQLLDAKNRVGDPGFNYLQLAPVLESLLVTASPAERGMVVSDQRQAQAEAKAEFISNIAEGIAAFLLTIFPPTAPLGMALGASLALKGLVSGYEDLQQGILLKEATGADDVFTPEQQEAADQLIIGGTLSMVMSAVDLAGMGAELLPARRGAAGAAGELGAIEGIEARAAGRHIEITGVNTENPHVRVTNPDGSIHYDGPLRDLEAMPGAGRLHEPPSSVRAGAEMPAEEGAFLRSTADVPSGEMTTPQLQREFEVARNAPRKALAEGGEYVEEAVLENGHTWRRTREGRWCRFSENPFCVIFGEGAEAGAIREVSPGAAGATRDPASRQAREELRGNMGPSQTGWQDHHIIPYELREHPAVRKAMEQGWNINGANNGVRLPSDRALPGSGTMAVHRGSHPAYTSWVESRLDIIHQRWRLGQLDDAGLLREVNDLVGEFRGRLTSGSIRLRTTIDF